jgi:hypothetical protein
VQSIRVGVPVLMGLLSPAAQASPLRTPSARRSTMQAHSAAPNAHYELRFTDLFNQGHGYVFPCDAHGSVDSDRLPERARDNYLYARGGIGWQFHAPVMRRVVEDGCERLARTS